jgi:hypothetical protein
VNKTTFARSSSHNQAIIASLLSRLFSKDQWLMYLPLAIMRRSSKLCAGNVFTVFTGSLNYYNKYVLCLCESHKITTVFMWLTNIYCVYVTLTNIYFVYVTLTNIYFVYVTLTNIYCVYVTLTNIYCVYVTPSIHIYCVYDSHNKYLLCLCNSQCDSLNKHLLCLCDSLNKYLLWLCDSQTSTVFMWSHNKYLMLM